MLPTRPVDRIINAVLHRTERFLTLARARHAAEVAQIHPRAVLLGESRIANRGHRSHIVVGENTHIRGELVTMNETARITVGRDVYIGAETRIWANDSIDIGNGVLISHGVEIHDDASEREPAGTPARIRVSDDVWIGFRSILLKGVTIGARTIVAAGSLVSDDLPEGVLAVGRPARVVRRLE